MALEIAVVVPTHNRPRGLDRLIAALGSQTFDTDRFEVLVVDDGSEPAAATLSATDLLLRMLRHEHSRGPAAARNTGWRASTAPIVAFVDDDCVPHERWLESIMETSSADVSGSLVVQGPVTAPPGGGTGAISPLTHSIEVPGPSRLFVSCNIAFGRNLLERVGGFDESFRRACGEDVELGARALAAGAQVAWSGGALVHHEVRYIGLRGALRQTMKWTDSVRTIAMHPELRDLLVARVFWKRTHPLLLLSLMGLGTRRPGVAALACAPYLQHYRKQHGGLRRGARWLPIHVVIDTCEIGTALVGSVHHRTVML